MEGERVGVSEAVNKERDRDEKRARKETSSDSGLKNVDAFACFCLQISEVLALKKNCSCEKSFCI